MPKRFFLAIAIILFLSSAFAISAQEAVNFATKQNNFLYVNETVEIYPNTRIGDKGKDYWVITCLSGNSLSGFVPVLDKSSPSIPESGIARRNLIKTAYVLRYQQKLNEASSRQGLWLFDATNAQFFSDLSQDLKNEKVDLTTVKTSLGGFSQLQDDVDGLIGMLDEMYPLAEGIGGSLSNASSFEAGFVAQPDTNKLGLFEDQFLDGLGLIQELGDARSEYLAVLDSLRQAIALTDLPLETKQGLNTLANIPSKLQQFSSKVTTAVDLEENISSIFDNAAASVDNFAADLLTREKRNGAFQAMYGQDEEVLLSTGQNTLSQLFDVLLDNEYFFRWENQEDLQNAKQEWEKAKSFYGSGSFQQAEQDATKAKKYALKVYAAGLGVDQPVFDTGLIFSVIILLIVAIIVIYALRNRGKIADLVSGEQEEVELHAWDK